MSKITFHTAPVYTYLQGIPPWKVQAICPHYPRSTPSQHLQRHPTVEGDFVYGNPGRINAHTQKQSAERAAPSSSAQRFALAAGGRLFRRRCANRSACNLPGAAEDGAEAEPLPKIPRVALALGGQLPAGSPKYPDVSHQEQNRPPTHISLHMCHIWKSKAQITGGKIALWLF